MMGEERRGQRRRRKKRGSEDGKEGSEDGKEEQGEGSGKGRTLLTPSQEAGPLWRLGAQSSPWRAVPGPLSPSGSPFSSPASGGPAAALLSSALALSGHRAA